MKLLLALILMTLLGPLRRPFFRHAWITIPATLGTIAGIAIGGYVVAMSGLGGFAAVLLVGALVLGLALTCAEAVKDWHDRMFGRKE